MKRKKIMKNIFTVLLMLIVNTSFSQEGALDSTFGSPSHLGIKIDPILDYGLVVNGGATAVIINSSDTPIIGATVQSRTSYSAPLEISFSCGVDDVSYSGSGYYEECESIDLFQNQKIIMVGYIMTGGGQQDIKLMRRNSNIPLDPSFGGAGTINLNIGYFDIAYGVKTLTDNKFYVCGATNLTSSSPSLFLLAKLNYDGTLDTGFGSNGYVTTSVVGSIGEAYDIDTQQDGKILLSGSSTSNFYVVRYLTNGTLDNTFATNGIKSIDLGGGLSAKAEAIKIQNDGKILIAGSFNQSSVRKYTVVRLNTDGSLDSSFGTNGFVSVLVGTSPGNSCKDMQLQADGKIILAGNLKNNEGIGLLRLNPNGTLDTSFGTNGITTTITSNVLNVSVRSISKYSNGGILVVGSAQENGDNKTRVLQAKYNATSSLGTHQVVGENINIFPNPSRYFIQIDSPIIALDTKFEIYDLSSKKVLSGTLNENKIDISQLNKGMYLLNVKNEDKVIETKKFIKE